ncbi:MAG: 1-deoxy-D-xylulose-5-phosphate synthase [Oscillospiraceae bacterium]|jgi:1-deoxy-D-xylulose-5-phosphate synthase|nr:1-deoxy-D-xylulose-5-phosphate synthase [Oscillospiraceae bacterium]
MSVLKELSSAKELAAMPPAQIDELCAELRREIISAVSKNGGHLASNLGAVELTVALHRVFDFSRDRLVFDVGHQSYAHKMLTGRLPGFGTLRKYGGLSGFPKPSESVYDAFPAGHASGSVSAALGLARARTLSGGTHSVVALIGDGALTGGLAYEALSDAGASGEPIIVVLNDNGMSISGNVGGVARYLSRERIRPSYIRFKKRYRALMAKLPGGRFIYSLTHRIKAAVRRTLLHCSMFEELGFEYIGPVDGHDVPRLCRVLSWARELGKPVLLHVKTQKGRGYTPSETEPDKYHGVSPSDFGSGKMKPAAETFSAVFGDTVTKLREGGCNIAAITAAMASGTGLSGFAERFPDRFFDVGISEGHAVTLAAGLAAGGVTPVFAVYSTFLQRGYDMLIHDIALSGAKAVFAIDRAGLVPGDGETHQGIYDVAYLATVPGLSVYAPASFGELRRLLSDAVTNDCGAVAIRYPKGAAPFGGDCVSDAVIRSGNGFTVVTYGAMTEVALEAAELLSARGIEIEIVKLLRITPLDASLAEQSASKTGGLLVLEDVAAAGCVGERLAAALAVRGTLPERVILLNCGDNPVPCGSVAELRRHCKIDAESVADAICGVSGEPNG